MILVILGIGIAMIVGGIILYECLYDRNFEGVGGFIGIFGGVITLAALIVTLCLVYDITELSVLDEKIAMYQEENTKIEEQIATVVENYQEYETDIFTEVKPESSVTLVAMYPELKSDTLVQEQIKVYTANNQKIKELKEATISGSVKRWWLYFGK